MFAYSLVVVQNKLHGMMQRLLLQGDVLPAWSSVSAAVVTHLATASLGSGDVSGNSSQVPGLCVILKNIRW